MAPRPTDSVSLALGRLAAGDRAAFDGVFQQAWPAVRGLCARALGDGDDGEDAAQIALQKVFFEASDYDPERPALPWILAIASWECTTVKRRRSRHPQESLDSAAHAIAPQNPEDMVDDAALASSLESALGKLTEADRTTLRAAFSEEVRRHAPAAPRDRKRKERALKRLRELWRTLHGD